MRYMYKQMTSRYGFDDGNSVPAEAEAFRGLMVAVLNHKYKDSKYQLVESTTGHNPVTMYWIDKYTGNYCVPPEDIYEILDELDEEFDMSNIMHEMIEVNVQVKPKAIEELIDMVREETPTEAKKIAIGRPILGISLNGLEYALDEQGDILTFETEEQTLQFLRDNGCPEEELDYYTLEEVDVPPVKNNEVRHVLDLVIGDYLSILADAVEEGKLDQDNYNIFVDGLYEIGKAFDINIYDFDVDKLLGKEG